MEGVTPPPAVPFEPDGTLTVLEVSLSRGVLMSAAVDSVANVDIAITVRNDFGGNPEFGVNAGVTRVPIIGWNGGIPGIVGEWWWFSGVEMVLSPSGTEVFFTPSSGIVVA